MFSKKLDARSPSADNTAAYEEQKFEVLVTKAMCYWYRDVTQRGYDPEGDFGMHVQGVKNKKIEKELSATKLGSIREYIKR
mgnify:CR=1 FL=1